MVAGVRVVHLAVLGVAVAPEQQLLQHEEREDAAQDGSRGRMRIAAFEGVRNDFQERRAEQRADGKGHQHRHPRCAQQQRKRRQPGGQRATNYTSREDPAERHEGWRFYAR